MCSLPQFLPIAARSTRDSADQSTWTFEQRRVASICRESEPRKMLFSFWARTLYKHGDADTLLLEGAGMELTF